LFDFTERLEGVGKGGGGLLAVAWILAKGGPFRTWAYASFGKGYTALAAQTDDPVRLLVTRKIAIGVLIFGLPGLLEQ
jgi:hypothetical protein